MSSVPSVLCQIISGAVTTGTSSGSGVTSGAAGGTSGSAGTSGGSAGPSVGPPVDGYNLARPNSIATMIDFIFVNIFF